MAIDNPTQEQQDAIAFIKGNRKKHADQVRKIRMAKNAAKSEECVASESDHASFDVFSDDDSMESKRSQTNHEDYVEWNGDLIETTPKNTSRANKRRSTPPMPPLQPLTSLSTFKKLSKSTKSKKKKPAKKNRKLTSLSGCKRTTMLSEMTDLIDLSEEEDFQDALEFHGEERAGEVIGKVAQVAAEEEEEEVTGEVAVVETEDEREGPKEVRNKDAKKYAKKK